MTGKNYGVGAAVAAGAGAGLPKLKFTVGAFSEPVSAWKNARGLNPNILFNMLVGNLSNAVFKSCTALL
jgi:hypothetical protein